MIITLKPLPLRSLDVSCEPFEAEERYHPSATVRIAGNDDKKILTLEIGKADVTDNCGNDTQPCISESPEEDETLTLPTPAQCPSDPFQPEPEDSQQPPTPTSSKPSNPPEQNSEPAPLPPTSTPTPEPEPPQARTICNTCGADITGNVPVHGTGHLLKDEPFSYRVE